MKVKIKSCHLPTFWYKKLIGKKVYVDETTDEFWKDSYVLNEKSYYILGDDKKHGDVGFYIRISDIEIIEDKMSNIPHISIFGYKISIKYLYDKFTSKTKIEEKTIEQTIEQEANIISNKIASCEKLRQTYDVFEIIEYFRHSYPEKNSVQVEAWYDSLILKLNNKQKELA